MLEKASVDDIKGFQAFTVRNLDNKLSTNSDTEQYKLLSVKEDPIDNRQQYLDVMCFPSLFPTGKFGKHHPRAVKLSHSEYIKLRLLNPLNPIVHFWLHHTAHCAEKIVSARLRAGSASAERVGQGEVGGVTGRVLCTWWLLGLALKRPWLVPGGQPHALTAWTGLENTTLTLQRACFWQERLLGL